MFSNFKRKAKSCSIMYSNVGQKFAATVHTASKAQLQFFLFAFGIVVLSAGLFEDAMAQAVGPQNGWKFNGDRLQSATNAIFLYLEGSFGALVMVCSGVGAILSAAFGQYRASLGLMVVALGSFTLRSFVATFFNDTGIK